MGNLASEGPKKGTERNRLIALYDIFAMLKDLSEPASELKRFRTAPWKHQHTFKTPLKDLQRFVSTLLEPYSLDSGSLSTDEVVFEPKSVLKFVADSGIELKNSYKFSLAVEGQSAIAELLKTVLSDWIDFLFLPAPPLFAIYADHDEYITFYAPDFESLNVLVRRLQAAGFEDDAGYSRGSEGKKWR